MPEFHVEYRIEIDADSPRDAVDRVAMILAGGGALVGNYHVMEYDGVQAPLRPGEIEIDLDESDLRECSRCGEEVLILNSQDECAGCEEERAQHRVCISCDESIPDDEQGFRWADGCQICSGCAHDAYRSGWSGAGVNSAHPHGF